MMHYLLKTILFCIIKVNCEDYGDVNNSISLESEENIDINEVFDSAEYLDTREDEIERNNTEYNKSVRDISPEINNNIEEAPVTKKLEKAVECDSLSDFHGNITNYEKSMIKSNRSENKDGSSINEKVFKNSTVVNFPYTVSIQRKGSHYATGVLLNNQTILTTAADFYNVRESIKLYRVRLGSVNCKKGGVLLPIKRITIHPYYAPGAPRFDLAVIKLSTQVPLTENIKPIQLSNVTQKVISAKFMTTYWPRLIFHDRSLPKSAKERVKHHSMRISTQKMIPWKSCSSFMESADVVLDPINLCLKPIVSHHSLCMPDAGAPVIADDVLWGVTSGWTSNLCQSQPSPTIFTRVSMKPVRKWLQTLL